MTTDTLVNIVFGGMGGAVVASIVAYLLHLRTKKPKKGRAYEVLKGLGKILEEPEGDYYTTRSTDDNFHVANHIYSHADGEIIATAFGENPATYGERDLARAFRYGGSLFTRITSEDVCDPESQKAAADQLGRIQRDSRFVVLPRSEPVTRIDGILCRFQDKSHLCFVSLRGPKDQAKNKGIVFREDFAENLFSYYEGLVERFLVQPGKG